MTDEIIHRDPEIMLGKPVVRGTRITVEHILRQLSFGATKAEIMSDYGLTAEQFSAALAYAANNLSFAKLHQAA